MFEEIFAHLPDAILIVGKDGFIQQANARATVLFGYTADELQGLPIEALIPERLSHQHVKNREEYFKHPHIRPMGSELNLSGRRKDDSEFPVDITLGPLGKEQEAVVCAVRDITEQVQLLQTLAEKNKELHNMTQQLWQTAKLATMGELAASIAHELNNPLGIVSLRVESLLSQIPNEDPKYRALEIVAGETDRMANLVANLLQFSRKQARQISTLDICTEIEYTLELIQYHLQKRQIDLQINTAESIPPLQADRQALRQLLLNILTNASDAMPQGGHLNIDIQSNDKDIIIIIKDDGSGIATEDLPKVTESFFTTKPEGAGTGLGLAICRRIIQEHQGTFEISSAGLGQGTQVKIILPRNDGEMHSDTN